MSRHSDLFSKVFERSAERNIAGAKRSKAAAAHLRKFMNKAEMDEEHPVAAIAELLEELAEEQANSAGFDLECCKAFAKAEADDDLQKLVPTRISAVVPTAPVTPVLRTGQRQIPLSKMVDPQFAKLVEVDEEERNAW
jgi:hypothetical protein